MKIKTYIVDNLSEAYPLIFQELGEEAIILNTKPIKKGGIFGLFGKKQVEVVAAADLSKGMSAHAGKATTHERIPNNNGAEFISLKTSDEESQKNSVVIHSNHEEITQPKKQPLADIHQHAFPPIDEDMNSQQEVLKELSEMKGLIQSMMKEDSSLSKRTKPFEKWMARLQDHEVDEEVIQYIIKKTQQKHGNLKAKTEAEQENFILNVIIELFQEGISKETEQSQSTFITLVGPTGVGKTTTIAKLAGAKVFQQRQRVGLLTTDTFRIGAVEQLRTYANILNVPLEVVEKPEELAAAMEELDGCHYVYMDSAGRNYLDEENINEINQYLRYDSPQENYLVLSMTTRWKDMKKIVEQMKSVPIDKLILTKWDETSCYGAALNMLYHYPYPLAYICLGQGVPQDIMKADPIFMAKKLLGVDENDKRSSTSLKTII